MRLDADGIACDGGRVQDVVHPGDLPYSGKLFVNQLARRHHTTRKALPILYHMMCSLAVAGSSSRAEHARVYTAVPSSMQCYIHLGGCCIAVNAGAWHSFFIFGYAVRPVLYSIACCSRSTIAASEE